MDCSKFAILKSFSRVPPLFLSVQDTPNRQYAIENLSLTWTNFATRRHPIYKLVYFQCSEKHTITIFNKDRTKASKCRDEVQKRNMKRPKGHLMNKIDN